MLFYCLIAPSTLVESINFYTPISKPLKGDELYIQIQAAELRANWLLNNDNTFNSGQAVLTVRWQDGKEDSTTESLYPLVISDVYSDGYHYLTADFGQHARMYHRNAKVAVQE